ncbi:MAG: hypothetical protein ACXVPQ_11610 [Bacteroidia bacterium]
MIELFKALLKDKLDNYCMRELTIGVCLLLIIASFLVLWIFNVSTPDYMFYSLMSLTSLACLGYSLEKKPITNPNTQTEDESNKN